MIQGKEGGNGKEQERGLIEFVGSPKTGWYQQTVGGEDGKGV